MRPYSIGGLILIALGILALSINSVTYFTTERVVGPLGFFVWDVERPHAIFMNPIVGIAAIVVGVVLMLMARRQTAT